MYILKDVFEWDSRKAAKNFEKHGVSFEETTSCFDDRQIVMGHDLEHSGAEDRYVAIAKSDQDRLLLFIFTIRRDEDGQETFRIISSRRANKEERTLYPRSR
ncbi:MAG: BrnT family toxin [Deltaproteobacteria bacterium]|nr:BrnT family toxin [Deltaproteobacteria bacterium]